jgi:hypothetical protein
MDVTDERCRFCRREIALRDWVDRAGWLEVDCPVCGRYRVERRFWAAAHFKQARSPARYRSLARWLAGDRDRPRPPEIPFEGWEELAEPPAGS